MTSEIFHCSTPVKIRFRDLDAFGHVNNAVYFTFMEMARVDYFTQSAWQAQRISFAVLHRGRSDLPVQSALQLDTPLIVQVRVSRLGNSSFDMEYRFVDESGGAVLATGRTVQVTFDYTANRSVPLPEEWRAAIVQFEGL